MTRHCEARSNPCSRARRPPVIFSRPQHWPSPLNCWRVRPAPISPVVRWGPTQWPRGSARGPWAMSTVPATRDCSAMSPSKSCRKTWSTIATTWCVSIERRRFWPRSITRTSPRSTAWSMRTGFRRSCSSWSMDRPSRTGSRTARFQSTARCRSRGRSRKHCTRRTSTESCIAI